MILDFVPNVSHAEERVFQSIKANMLPVVLFGAGACSEHVLAYLRQQCIEPICICDNNIAKQGWKHLGLPVCSHGDVATYYERYNLIVTVGSELKNELFLQLKNAGEKNPTWYLCGYELCGEKLDYHFVVEHVAQFDEAYFTLADELSRRVFINVLNAKVSGDFSLYKKIRSSHQYFEKEIVKLGHNEVLLDAGAYKGNSICEFVRQVEGKYDCIIACEPDEKTVISLRENISRNHIQRVDIVEVGLWNEKTSMCFNAGREGSSRLCPAHLEDNNIPTTSIRVDTIDNMLNDRRVSFILMDIEGSEHNALLGAEQTIRKWKPKMAVSVYHRREDLFDILLLLKQYVPSYKFYMRHYTDNQTETILYAI